MPGRHRVNSADPHDPLARRPDDPRIGSWWWATRLYRRERAGERHLFFSRPLVIALMVLLVGLVAFAVVRVAGG